MKDWNVVVTTRDGSNRARKLLRNLGRVERTHYRGVLVLHVAAPERFFDQLSKVSAVYPELESLIGRITPLEHHFEFESREQFETRLREIAVALGPLLDGRRFFVRMHRRGFKGKIRRPEAERELSELFLESLAARHASARVDFEDPDLVVVIETVDTHGGVGVFDRAELESHPLLRVDKSRPREAK